MFGWFRKSRPVIPHNAPKFDPSADLDVEAVFGAPRPAMAQAAPQARSATQEVFEIDPEDVRINTEAAHQAQAEVLHLMRESGVVWSDQEQFQRMLARSQEIRSQLVMFQAMVAQTQQAQEEAQRNFSEMTEKVISMRQRTSLDQLTDFWQEHPFLVGFFGADLIYKLKKQFGQH